jgi:hypothetical protein
MSLCNLHFGPESLFVFAVVALAMPTRALFLCHQLG